MKVKERSRRVMAILLVLIVLAAQVTLPVQAEEENEQNGVEVIDKPEDDNIIGDTEADSETGIIIAEGDRPDTDIKSKSDARLQPINLSAYNTGDIEVINNIIENNGLAADKNDVSNWNFVTWSTDNTNKRVERLNISNKELTGKLDVSGLTGMTYLYCQDNQLEELDISGLTNLIYLHCSSNQLKELDANGLSKLKFLYCADNELPEWNSTNGLDSLGTLDCSGNQLTKLIMPDSLDSLVSLICTDNMLTELNVNSLVNLTSLQCFNNQLMELDTSGLNNLTHLYCENNKLVKLEAVSTKLRFLLCQDNQLEELKVSHLTALQDLRCYNNRLEKLDASRLTALQIVHCYNNQLTELNLQGSTFLQALHCYDNQLMELNIRSATKIHTLRCNNNQLTELDLSKATNISTLHCHNNLLTELDLTGISKLEQYSVYVVGNPLQRFSRPDGTTVTVDATVGGKAVISAYYNAKAINTAIETITLTATAETEYAFTQWKDDQNLNIDNQSSISIAMPNVNTAFTAVFEGIVYNAGDIEAMNEIIAGHEELGVARWVQGKTPPADWNNLVTWSGAPGNKRIVQLNAQNRDLKGTLNVSELAGLVALYCNDNQLEEVDINGLRNLTTLCCQNNPIRRWTNQDGYTLTVNNNGGKGNIQLTSYQHNTGAMNFTAAPAIGYSIMWQSDDITIDDPGNNVFTMIMGANNYTLNVRFEPIPMKSFLESVSLSESSFTYTGEAVRPDVTLTFLPGVAIEAADYEILYEDNINAGTGKAVIRGLNNYEDSEAHIIEFTIEKATPAVVWPETKWVNPGTTLGAVEFAADGKATGVGNTDITGTFAWEKPDSILTGSGLQRMTFTPDDSRNYHTVFDDAPVSVNNMELKVLGEPTVDETFTVIPSSYGDAAGWNYDSDILEAEFFDGYAMFIPNLDGPTQITYTNSAGMTASADIQIMKNTMTGIYAEGYNGAFDNKFHSINVNNVPVGAKVEYSVDNGSFWSEINPAFIAMNTDIEVYYRVSKPGYHDVTGSAVIKIGTDIQNRNEQSENKMKTGDCVKTGDTSYLYLWILVFGLSGTGIVVYKRRSNKG